MQIQKRSLHLFRLFGVDVFVHWSWALVAILQIWWQMTPHGVDAGPESHIAPHGLAFCIAQYLCLFLIVLIHEFGHALACKSVGGTANRIILWPLGGVAFVNPPPRPGALLWSIAAGPLVNVVLLPITIIPAYLTGGLFLDAAPLPNFLGMLAWMNLALLVFNMLPVYPLDGGQIFRALAWFLFGRGTSLIIAAAIGLAGAAALIAAALYLQSIWFIVLALFMAFQSFRAVKIGQAMRRIDNAPRHPIPRCPRCGQNPPIGNLWRCPCGNHFDTFATNALCPRCHHQFPITACPLCGQPSPLPLWYPPSTSPLTIPPQPTPVPAP